MIIWCYLYFINNDIIYTDYESMTFSIMKAGILSVSD